MKLVDVLARKLKVWPDTTYLAQDSDGYVCGWAGIPIQGGSEWCGAAIDKCRPGKMDLACDHTTSTVTRAEWQAAVDALNAPKVVEWDGVGLPPVGVDCEVENEVLGGWDRAEKILAHSFINGKDVAVFQRGDLIAYSRDGSFRPIRTAEQVAAEEREKAINLMIDDSSILAGTISDRRAMARQLYDAGYRKEPKPCGS